MVIKSHYVYINGKKTKVGSTCGRSRMGSSSAIRKRNKYKRKYY